MRAGQPPGPNWAAFSDMTGRVARAVFPTLTQPLISRADLRARLGDDVAWEALVERPLGETLAHYFADDLERGIIATDALIGTFAGIDDESLRQNRCFLYHVIGNGTGDWDVPVGGMGKLTESLAGIAWAAGAELRTGVEVTGIETDGGARRCASRAGRSALVTCWPTSLPPCWRGCWASRPRSRGPRAPSSSSTCCSSGCRSCVTARRSARGVRGDLPCQRVRDPARGRLRAGPRRSRA